MSCGRYHAQGSTGGAWHVTAARPQGSSSDELDAKVAASHAASDRVYGAPRILADLRAAGERVSRKRRWRPGHAVNTWPGTFAPATTVADPYAPLPKDLVGRRWTPES
jgi:putative transposase